MRQRPQGDQERRGDGEQDDRHHPDHVDRRQDQGEDHAGQLQQEQEGPVVGLRRVGQRGQQLPGGILLADVPAFGQRGGHAVGDADRAADQDRRQVRGDEPGHDPGGDLLG
jgi:hypothetical protein